MTQIQVIVHGVRIELWAIRAVLAGRQMVGDIRWVKRGQALSDSAEITLLTWSRRPILEALADPSGRALRALIAMVRVLAARSYGVQVILGDGTIEGRDDVYDATPGQLQVLVPALMSRNVMFLVRIPEISRAEVRELQ